MPDSPDYSKYLTISARFSLQDMGELAARLGSISTYDRRGEVIFYDDFRYGLGGWTLIPQGAGSSLSLTADNTYRSPYACKLITDAAVNSYATLRKLTGVIDIDRAGIEFGFDCQNDHDGILAMAVYVYNGVRYLMTVKADRHNDAISILGDDGAYHTITTYTDKLHTGIGHNFIKLVWDVSDKKYVRLLVNGLSYSISSYGLFYDAAVISPVFYVDMQLKNQIGTGATTYLHYFILTANEP